METEYEKLKRIESLEKTLKEVSKEIEALKNTPKYIEGNWYWAKCNGVEKPYLIKFKELGTFYKSSIFITRDGSWNGCGGFDSIERPATVAEVEQHLIAEAKKRGFVKGAKFKGSSDKTIWTFEDFWFNGKNLDIVWSSNCGIIYKEGVWSEIIEVKDQPILIGGKYAVIIHEGSHVVIDGHTYTKSALQEVKRVLNLHNVKHIVAGCSSQITIDHDLITQILKGLK